MTPEQISSIVRHLATFFGGLLVAKLSIPPEYLESIIGGVAAVAAVVWGIVSKKPLPPMAPPQPIPIPPTDSTMTKVS